jgi:hypothetical protein
VPSLSLFASPCIKKGNTMRIKSLFLLLFALLLCALVSPSRAEVYQWSVPVESVMSDETKDHPRAFLYIPPSCKRVRAVIVGQHNLLEETVLRNPIIRQALADNDMAAVWVTPSLAGVFHYEQGAGEHFNGMMKALAQESGYSELEWAPIIPIGHSAMAGYPYQFATWNPGRTLVAISIKGQWPDSHNPGDPPFDDARLNGVPLLYINGEYEDANGRAAKAASFRARYPQSPLTMVADVGAGHFDFHDRIATYMALYLRKVAQYRLPATLPLSGPVTLTAIDPIKTGWLYDRWRRDQEPKAPPAPLDQYTGPKNEAFWAFDSELAQSTNDYTQRYQNKKPELLGYIQNGAVVPQNPKAHEQVQLKVAPQEDGKTFKISGTFIATVPEGRPPGWTGLPVGSPISHAEDGGPIVIEVTTGPLHKVSDDTFVIRFNRIDFNPRRGGDVWFQATQDGGTEYKRAVQQAEMRIPVRNTAGADQSISFPALANQNEGVKTLKLSATSNANVPVSCYVESGPAEVEGDTLTFTPIPARSKFPVKVTVVAYQWGRSIEPRLKSAETVKQTFFITKPGATVNAAQQVADAKARVQLWEQVAAGAQALAPQAAPTANTPLVTQGVLVSDSFDSNTPMTDRIPDVTNLTGGKWGQNGKNGVNATWDKQARIGASMGDGIALVQYSGAAKLNLSVTFNLARMTGDQGAGPAVRGAGLGFFSAVSNTAVQGSDAFTGLAVDRTGSVRLIVDGSGTSTLAMANNFNPDVDHTLSYIVDTKAGTISEVRLDGNAVALNVPANTFTAARLAYAGFYSSGTKGDDETAFDNFSVTAN